MPYTDPEKLMDADPYYSNDPAVLRSVITAERTKIDEMATKYHEAQASNTEAEGYFRSCAEKWKAKYEEAARALSETQRELVRERDRAETYFTAHAERGVYAENIARIVDEEVETWERLLSEARERMLSNVDEHWAAYSAVKQVQKRLQMLKERDVNTEHKCPRCGKPLAPGEEHFTFRELQFGAGGESPQMGHSESTHTTTKPSCLGFVPGADPSRCLYCGVKVDFHVVVKPLAVRDEEREEREAAADSEYDRRREDAMIDKLSSHITSEKS